MGVFNCTTTLQFSPEATNNTYTERETHEKPLVVILLETVQLLMPLWYYNQLNFYDEIPTYIAFSRISEFLCMTITALAVCIDGEQQTPH